MKKLVTSIIVAAVFGAWAKTEMVGGYTWTYRINGDTAEIYTGSFAAISPAPTGAVTIPSMLGGRPVTRIGDCAFYGCGGLTSMTIGSSITSIGFEAFYGCNGLVSITVSTDNLACRTPCPRLLIRTKDGWNNHGI